MTNTIPYAHKQSGKISDKQAERNRTKIEITGIEIKKEVKLRKDGQPKRTHTNKQDGISSSVDPFKTKEDIQAIYDVLDNAILKAEEDYRNGITEEEIYVYKAYRDKLFFKIGMNIGLRISDLLKLKYSDFITKDRNGYVFSEDVRIKTKKTGDYVDVDYNEETLKVFKDFYNRFPIECEEDLNKYLFTKNIKDKNPKHFTEQTAWNIIKQITKQAGLKGNYGTHSLRKTYGYRHWHDAEDKSKALSMLNHKFSHNSLQCTMIYIGITREEEKKFANEINL